MSESEGPAWNAPAPKAELHPGGNAAAAWQVFETYREELLSLFAEVRAGQTERAGKLAAAVKELAKAVTMVIEEGGRLHGQRRRLGLDLSEQSHDLGAARREVRRRLARLRGAG